MRSTGNGVAERNGSHPQPRTTLRLAEARKETPAVDPVDAVKRSLVMAVYGQIGEEDVEEIVQTIVEKAKAGDRTAAKMMLDLITKSQGGKTQVIEKPVMVEAGAKQLRLLAAYAIDKNGPMPVEALAKLVGMSDSDTAALLDGCWFLSGPKGLTLTNEGKRQVG
jgi:hypothetical protein